MNRFKLVKDTAWAGIATNMILFTGKLIIGFRTKSQGMIADGFNSLSDVFTSVTALIGGHVASQPQDEEHPWGHGKAEYIASFVIALFMILISVLTLRSALISLFKRTGFTFSLWLVAISVSTIILKFFLYIKIEKYKEETGSLLIHAAAEDHRNDAFVTIGTLIGILAALLKIYWLDSVIGAIISIWIGYTGIRIIKPAFNVLMDSPIENSFIKEMWDNISLMNGVSHIDVIKSKPVGAKYIIFVKVSVPADMTVLESHSIAGKIRSYILKKPEVQDAIVHINPV